MRRKRNRDTDISYIFKPPNIKRTKVLVSSLFYLFFCPFKIIIIFFTSMIELYGYRNCNKSYSYRYKYYGTKNILYNITLNIPINKVGKKEHVFRKRFIETWKKTFVPCKSRYTKVFLFNAFKSRGITLRNRPRGFLLLH